jgi:hypothetical protein
MSTGAASGAVPLVSSTSNEARAARPVAADDPKLSMLAIYAATGRTEFVIQSWLLARHAIQPDSGITPTNERSAHESRHVHA